MRPFQVLGNGILKDWQLALSSLDAITNSHLRDLARRPYVACKVTVNTCILIPKWAFLTYGTIGLRQKLFWGQSIEIKRKRGFKTRFLKNPRVRLKNMISQN